MNQNELISIEFTLIQLDGIKLDWNEYDLINKIGLNWNGMIRLN